VNRTIRYVAAVALGLAAGALLFHPGPAPGPGPRLGSEAPPLALPALAGAPVSLTGLRGQVVVVNFWATWCAPCVAELPSLDRLQRALGGEGLRVLAVSVDADGAALARFVREANLELPVLRDRDGHAAAAWGVDSFPATFVVDVEGVVRESYLGPARWDEPAALAHFRGLVAGGPNGPGLVPASRCSRPSTAPTR